FLCLSAQAQTTTVALDGSVHPSAAGWTYFGLGNSLTGTQAFTLADGVIEQHTMGAGYAGQGSNYFYTNIAMPLPSSWILRTRVRVAASELWTYPFGAFVAFGNTGIGLMANSMSLLFNGTWSTLAYQATAWHDYRMEVAACGRWTLFIDDQFFQSGVGANTQGTLPLAFGDGTGGANADVLYDFVELTVNTGQHADFNGDGHVNGADLGILLSAWGQPGVTDLDCSGSTDGADLGILLSSWG
ncbi:MAG: hypothetical protein JNK53_03445, partial [Phycisphaerae bacterium]|nr:hypothetical protein [Phycisphaerae bacterium]